MKNMRANETSASREAEAEMSDSPESTTHEEVRSWTCNQFAITNHDGNTIALLRKLADELEQLGPINILDITYNQSDPSIGEITVSVYFSFADDG
jgi:hypothetical protein